jgi:hypothetical protein
VRSSIDPCKRKSDPEQCDAAGLIFRPQLPLVHFHNGSRDGQPHAHAFGSAGALYGLPTASPLTPDACPACAVAPVCAARRLSTVVTLRVVADLISEGIPH